MPHWLFWSVRIKKTLKFPEFWVQDCSLAAQNILLAAHRLFLGVFWTGIRSLENFELGIKNLLDLGENIWPLALIPIGYPAVESPSRDSYDESRVHYNKLTENY